MSGPLTGVRVVELAGLGALPFATLKLADMGADVIRVEQPGKDRSPEFSTVKKSPEVEERETLFDALNRNKRSMILNLKDPNGLRVEIMGETTTEKGN